MSSAHSCPAGPLLGRSRALQFFSDCWIPCVHLTLTGVYPQLPEKNKVLPACIFSCCAHLGKGPFTWSSTLLNKDSIFRLLPFPDPTK